MTRSQGYKKSDEAKRQLLDAMEEICADKGYQATSVRDVTNYLGMRLAAVNYHFGSKDNLFAEVIHRRVEPLGKARLDKLKQGNVSPDTAKGSIRSIVEAFASPMIDFCLNGDPGWRHYCRLVAQIAAQEPAVTELVSKEYDPVALEFIQAIKTTLPQLDDYYAQCAFQFLLGNTLYVVCDNKRIDKLSKGAYLSSDLVSLSEPFYRYVSGGIIAMADS